MSDVESDDYSEDDRACDETDHSEEDEQEGLFDILSESDCASDSDIQKEPQSQQQSKNAVSFPVASELKKCQDLIAELAKLSDKSKLETKYEDLLNAYVLNLLFASDKKNKDHLSSCVSTLHQFHDFKRKMEELLKNKSAKLKRHTSVLFWRAKEEQEEENVNMSQNSLGRLITYQMLKNKGLTPHRNKKNKNPRLKNRNKFKKALVRRKGAIPNMRKKTEAYAGEQRGIDPYIVRSVKFQKK